MTNEEISKWLMNLKDDIGKTQYQPLWHYAEALGMAIKALTAQSDIPTVDTPTVVPTCEDTISRKAALNSPVTMVSEGLDWIPAYHIKALPSAQPEPAIPLQWIEAEIKWLKSLDNAVATSKAEDISAMVNIWKEKQDG